MSNFIDTTANDLLDKMRSSRDASVRYGQTLNDEAFQLEQAAVTKRELARHIIREVNEGTPVSPDDE